VLLSAENKGGLHILGGVYLMLRMVFPDTSLQDLSWSDAETRMR